MTSAVLFADHWFMNGAARVDDYEVLSRVEQRRLAEHPASICFFVTTDEGFVEEAKGNPALLNVKIITLEPPNNVYHLNKIRAKKLAAEMVEYFCDLICGRKLKIKTE